MIDTEAIRQRWEADGSKRDERGQRLFAASEARAAHDAVATLALAHPDRAFELDGEPAIEIMDRMSRRYTGRDFPMRSAIVSMSTTPVARYTALCLMLSCWRMCIST